MLEYFILIQLILTGLRLFEVHLRTYCPQSYVVDGNKIPSLESLVVLFCFND